MIEVKTAVNGPIRTNTYVVRCGNEVVIIDAEAEISQLKPLIGDAKVKGVFLTHAHFDHMTHLDEIIKEFNTKCYLSKPAKKKLKDPLLNCSVMMLYGLEIKASEDDLVEVKDGDFLNLFDEEIKIIETPGHTDCCICIKIGDVIFSGDTIFDNCHGRTDLPTSNPASMVASLERLNKEYKGTKIYPAHGRQGKI